MSHFELGLISRCTQGGTMGKECRKLADEPLSCLSLNVKKLLCKEGTLLPDSSGLDDNGLFVWSRLEQLQSSSHDEACSFLLDASWTLSKRRKLFFGEMPELRLLDLYDSGALQRAWTAHEREGELVGPGLIVLAHMEAFVKLHLPLHWTQSRGRSVPHRISDLLAHEDFRKIPK
jgi:hypothetical protein